MKGTRRLPDIGINVPAWAQDFMVAIKKMLTPPTFPQADKVLLYNATTGLTDWVSLASNITVSSGSNPELATPPVTVNPPPFDDMEEDYPVGAVAFTTGINPSVLYGVGIWSAITGPVSSSISISGSITAISLTTAVTFPACPAQSSVDATVAMAGVLPDAGMTVTLGVPSNLIYTYSNVYMGFITAPDTVTIREVCVDTFGIGGFTETFTIKILT